MKLLRWSLIFLVLVGLGAASYNYFAPDGALSCTGQCLTQNVDLNSGVFLLNTLPNSKLANSALTINGTSVALGATRTLTLASADFANQGTSTTLLHGNAAGNPSFGPVNLATDVSGVLSLANIATCATNQVLFASASTAAACSNTFTFTTSLEPTLNLLMSDNTANRFGQYVVAQNAANTGARLSMGIDTHATGTCMVPTNGGTVPSPAPAVNTYCAFIWAGIDSAGASTPIVIAQEVSASKAINLFDAEQGNAVLLGIGATTPVRWLQATSSGSSQATVQVGDTNTGSATNIVGGSAANTLINGSPACSTATGCPATSTALTGTTCSIGGALLAAGGCSAGTVSITGATTSMAVAASPASGTNPDPGSLGVYWRARISSANTITVNVCTPLAGTPTADTYNGRVLQ